MAVCDVSSQGAFYSSSAIVDENLVPEFTFLNFHYEAEPFLVHLWMVMYKDHDGLSVISIPRNLKLFSFSISAPLM